MLDHVLDSMLHWYRLMGGASEGAHLVEREGVQATVVSAAPERSVMNAVMYRSPEALAAAYDELEAAYAEAGANWTVWVPPGDERSAALLAERGHLLDAEPVAMGLRHDGRPRERPSADSLRDWTAAGELRDVAAVNDRAYPFGTDSFARALRTLPDGAAHVYVARERGEPVACLLTVDHEGNAEVQVVAVVPEARGRGLSGKLLAHALADATERGSHTSTLIATKLGYPVYERAGFESLGRMAMWERRAG